LDPLDRFWIKVNKNSGTFGANGLFETECWEWTASLTAKGYGRFWPIGRRGYHAHRYSWIIHFGKIDDEVNVCHKCDNRKCIRPDHLFIGTQIENIKDMDLKGRRQPARGPSHGNVKLTPGEVLTIRSLWPSTRYCDIARDFNISHGTVMDIVKRRSWKHI